MKRLCLILLCICLVMISSSLLAQERIPLGNGNFALKLGYIKFTTDRFAESSGMYLGIEGYGKITSRLYLGAEVGSSGTADFKIFSQDDVESIYYEINLKYVVKNTSRFVLDIGTGLSYNDIDLRYSGLFVINPEYYHAWLFGSQFFTDLIYNFKRFNIGFNAKYQITEDAKTEARWGTVALDNLRLGMQIGIMF